MFKHIVMWTFKEENKQDNLRKAREVFLDMKNKIDVIRGVEVGIDTIRGEASYDIVLTVTLDSANDLPVYINHPEHKKVADFIGKVRDKRVNVDYEI
jgi:phage terminase large subunit